MSVYKKNSLITLDESYQLMTSLQIHSKWTKLQTMSPLQRMTFDHFYNLQDITFVPNFGTIARPLTRKIHKDLTQEELTWSDSDQQAFETCTCLITPPILVFPNFDLEILLFTDVSDYGIGAVLSQIHEGKEVVIAYAPPVE